MDDEHADVIVRVAAIVTLGVVILGSIIGLTVVAVATDRELARPEGYTFGGVVILAMLGGLSWATLRRRRHWRVNVERDDPDDG